MRTNYELAINRLLSRSRQAGGLTIFTAIFVLILMTLMLFYAARVGLLEQRVSANDMRQKLAFQAAEAGMDYAVEYFRAANARVISASDNATPDGDPDWKPGDTVTYRAGWFSAGNILWTECPPLTDPPDETHPCGGEISSGGLNSYYYDDPDTATSGAFDALPLDVNVLADLPLGTQVRVTAVICPRTLDNPACDKTLIPDPGDPAVGQVVFGLMLLAYGYSDCNDDNADGDIDLPDECRGRANVTRPFGSVEVFKGSPTVPLVSKNMLPTGGTAEVVPNPDGGGEGVPLSVWANAKTSECIPRNPDGSEVTTDPVELTGNFLTCEMQEWYGVDSQPADAKCNQPQCACDYPGPEPISYRQPPDPPVFGIDIMLDDQFPCDLFEFYFGYPRAEYQAVKANATVIDDCAVLNEQSYGFYWFSGDTCTLGDVGTINNTVVLISAAEKLTTIGGNASFFGILYIADVEDTTDPPDAAFKPAGTAIVYGAVIVDVLFDMSSLKAAFAVVYNEAGLANAGGSGGLGGLAGGWRDFGMPAITWE